jgi:hypothetical protein
VAAGRDTGGRESAESTVVLTAMAEGAHVDDGEQRMGRASHGSATVSRALLMWASRPATPSPTTMARTTWPPLVGAMVAIKGGGQNGDETQRRPEHSARTGAPGHTRTALPGSPTGKSRKDVPVRLYPEHEDENGAAVMIAGVDVKTSAGGVRGATVGVPVPGSCVTLAAAAPHVSALRNTPRDIALPFTVPHLPVPTSIP